MTKAELEAQVRMLIGHRLKRVAYTKLSYDSWDAYPDLFEDCVLQIVLDTESGDRFFCSWSTETSMDYGVSLGRAPYYETVVLRPAPGPEASDGLHTVDVSERSGWQPFLHDPIVDVRVHWLETTSYEVGQAAMGKWRQGEEVVLSDDLLNGCVSASPQDLEIVFESGRSIMVSAASYNEALDTLQPMMDELVVIFRPEVAARYDVGRPAP
ncbi:hypothetical protein D3C72_961090 [compost metagenome]